MAKGVEDTAFYVYNRLLALNEVGGSPDQFGLAVEESTTHFDAAALSTRGDSQRLQRTTPNRSEDVRSRLRVLSETPDTWHAALVRWCEMNRPLRIDVEGGLAPDANEEWFLYQTLLGAWPIEPCDSAEYQAFVRRIRSYMRKSSARSKGPHELDQSQLGLRRSDRSICHRHPGSKPES